MHLEDHGHDHEHLSGHGHSHGPANYSKAFAIGIVLNFVFVLVESTYGYYSNSLALIADAGHNLSDVLGLLVAWAATLLMRRKPSARFTYGLRSSSILAALFNALVLLLVIGGILWEAVIRFKHPEPVMGSTMMLVATVGILINGFTALLFMSGSKHDLNIRGAFLHMAMDALVSVGVVIAGLIILKTGWLWLDPAVSIVIGLIIVVTTWNLFKESVGLALDAVPSNIDAEAVRNFLKKLVGVKEVHDLHIWAMSTADTALTAHLVIPGGHPGDKFLGKLSDELKHHFKINHVTVQIEVGDCAQPCALEPDDVV